MLIWSWEVNPLFCHRWRVRLIKELHRRPKLRRYWTSRRENWMMNRRRSLDWNLKSLNLRLGGFQILRWQRTLGSRRFIHMAMAILNQRMEDLCMVNFWKRLTSIRTLEETSRSSARSMEGHFLVELSKYVHQVLEVPRKDPSRWLENQFLLE